MNTIYKGSIWIMLCLGLLGCHKFLEEKSQDEIKPSTVTDLQELLMGVVYPVGSTTPDFQTYLDLMTDDMTSNFNSDPAVTVKYQQYTGPFTWQKDMYETMTAAGNLDENDTYEHYYRGIMGCNVVLEQLDKVRGDDADKGNVRGQALAMRSFFYFMLVNLYGQPYNAAGVDITTSPGVELILSSVVHDAYPKRASVAQIYQQVEADLLEALPLMVQYGTNNNKFKVTELFVYTLLSRMYLYEENWAAAQKYATLALLRNSSLVKLANITIPYYDFTAPATGVYSLNSVETIWLGYGDQLEYGHLVTPAYGLPAFCISPDLQNKYEYDANNTTNRGDLRLRFYYTWNYQDYNWDVPAIIAGCRTAVEYNGAVKGMRVAELYLNRAESIIQQYLKNGDETLRQAALADLNYLRSYRYDTRNVAYVPVDYSGQALLDFCRDERRRELSFEDHRWFDLRRYGMPEIRHTFQQSAGQAAVEYVLAKGSNRYVLPIAQSVLAKNPAMVPNP